eukprot:1342609-Prymnesium_polylepis.1
MVLSHADAVEIAAATPKYAPAGSGGLPLGPGNLTPRRKTGFLDPSECVYPALFTQIPVVSLKA